MKALMSNSVYFIIKSFMEKLTVDQWRALTSAAPTNVTNILVAEMTLNIIDTVAESAMSGRGSWGLAYVEEVGPGLELLLQQSFCDALHMKGADESLRSLTKMIQQENRERLKSLQAGPDDSSITCHLTAPSRLNRMVCCVNDLFRKVGAKLMALFQASEDGDEQEEEGEVAPEDQTGGKSITPDSIREKIGKELRDISTHLMEDVSRDEFKGVEFVRSEEIESVGKEVSLLAEAEGKRSFKGLKKQLRLVCANSFLRVWLCRLVAQLKEKHQEDVTVERCGSIVDQLTPQLLKDLSRQDEDLNTPLKVKARSITGAKVLLLFQRLAPLLLHRSSQTIASWNGPADGDKLLPQEKSEVYNDLRRKSWICTVLMKWFLKTVVKGLGARLKHCILEVKAGATLMEASVSDPEAAELPEPPSATLISVPTNSGGRSVILETWRREEQQPVSAEEQRSPGVEGDIKMSYVKTFLEKVVFHVCDDAHVFGNKCKVNDGIFEKVWAEVKNHNIYVTARTFRNLDQEIHQHLCGRFKPLEMLCLMTLQDPVVTELCISLVKKRLMRPPQEASARRFFSSVVKVLLKPFR